MSKMYPCKILSGDRITIPKEIMQELNLKDWLIAIGIAVGGVGGVLLVFLFTWGGWKI